MITSLSSALQSQTYNKYLVDHILYRLDRYKWAEKYNRHDLKIEAWSTGLWVKQAGTIISYRELAAILKEQAENKAEQLPVDRIPTNIKDSKAFAVSSRQDHNKKYIVQFSQRHGWSCNCMQYRCWENRISTEFPQLYKALNYKIFCHHIVAAYNHNK